MIISKIHCISFSKDRFSLAKRADPDEMPDSSGSQQFEKVAVNGFVVFKG